MKLKYITTSLFAAAALALTGCVGDLDVTPLNDSVINEDEVYQTAEEYTQALNKIYAVWALSGQNDAGETDLSGLDAGNTVLLRTWFTLQTDPTDEAKCAWSNGWEKTLNSMTWGTTAEEPIEGAYYRCMYIVSSVNDFLQHIDNAPAEINKAQYKAEARFCRALAYYVLMDLFARPPFITETDDPTVLPSQLPTRADYFNWIESELNQIYNDLSDQVLRAPANADYGRANRYAADALLSRMYLNAEVYTGRTAGEDGISYLTKCITHCNNIIGSGKYQLADNYAEMFMADNAENANVNREFIFLIQADGAHIQSYGPGVFILATRSGDQGAESGISNGWAGFRSTGNLVRNFEFSNSDEATWAPDNILDKRGIFFNNNGKIALDITTTSTGTFDSEGWAVYKFTNIGSDGQPGKNTSFPDTDFPLFRLGEIYLNYAEAVARGGQGGSLTTAAGYINNLRDRGYGNNDASHQVNESWLTANSNSIGGKNVSVPYGNLLNERQREMYYECTRRTDLIRYGLFSGNTYTWAEKGGSIDGVGTDSRFNLFPIPTSDISVNGNLEQNEGYK